MSVLDTRAATVNWTFIYGTVSNYNATIVRLIRCELVFTMYNELARYVNTGLAIKRFILPGQIEFTTSIGRTINVYRLLR